MFFLIVIYLMVHGGSDLFNCDGVGDPVVNVFLCAMFVFESSSEVYCLSFGFLVFGNEKCRCR